MMIMIAKQKRSVHTPPGHPTHPRTDPISGWKILTRPTHAPKLLTRHTLAWKLVTRPSSAWKLLTMCHTDNVKKCAIMRFGQKGSQDAIILCYNCCRGCMGIMRGGVPPPASGLLLEKRGGPTTPTSKSLLPLDFGRGVHPQRWRRLLLLNRGGTPPHGSG